MVRSKLSSYNILIPQHNFSLAIVYLFSALFLFMCDVVTRYTIQGQVKWYLTLGEVLGISSILLFF